MVLDLSKCGLCLSGLTHAGFGFSNFRFGCECEAAVPASSTNGPLLLRCGERQTAPRDVDGLYATSISSLI